MITVIGTDETIYRDIADTAFGKLALSGEACVEVLFYDEEQIRELNIKTRNIDKSTDVLSYPNLTEILPFTKENYPFDFDNEASSVFLGSIVICEQIALKQAEEYGHSALREKAYLYLHGLLHLLGYDHIKEDDKVKMRTAEEEILSALGVKR